MKKESLMKPIIAVELAGYMRTFNDCFRSWTNLLDYDTFDFHFFVETYTESGILPVNTGGNTGYKVDKTDIFDFSLLKESVDVKYLGTEETDSAVNLPGWDASRIGCMYRKILRCNKQRRKYAKNNNIDYAYVLRVRGDLFFTQKIDLPKTLDTNEIIVPARWGYVRDHENSGNHHYQEKTWAPKSYDTVVCDQFAIAGLNAMNAYAETGERIGNDLIEQNIYKSLDSSNIKIERKHFKLGVYNHKSGL